MKTHKKQIYTNRIIIFSIVFAFAANRNIYAESGSKSIFSDDGTSVMMNDDDAKSTPVTSPAKTKYKSKLSSQNTPQSHGNYQESAVTNVGIEAWIDLQDSSGRLRRVGPSYNFHSGDGIKLQVRSKSESLVQRFRI